MPVRNYTAYDPPPVKITKGFLGDQIFLIRVKAYGLMGNSFLLNLVLWKILSKAIQGFRNSELSEENTTCQIYTVS